MNRRMLRLGPLGRRLAAAFLLVAVAAIAVFAALTMYAARHEVDGLTAATRHDDLHATAVAAADAYQHAGSWKAANLAGAAAIAARGQATLTVLDRNGSVVAAPTDALASMMVRMHGLAAVSTPRAAPISAAVVADGIGVGTVELRFPTDTMVAERHVRDALSRNAALGVGIAALVALVVALAVSSWVTTPIRALTTATSRLSGGRRDVRVDAGGPGELGELAATFNAMADRLDREDRVRRNLVADVAHELRTPLAILQGTTESLLDRVNEPTTEILESLHEETVRLHRIVGDLETLASAEAAGLRLEMSPTDMDRIVEASVDLVTPLAEERHQTINVRKRGHGPTEFVNGDADRLQQVMLNLLSNALKFTPDNGTIDITLEDTPDSVVVSVADEGPGIPVDERPFVYERFWRSPTATAAGSGIGLAVVRELVEAHHGEVTLSESAGGGACFAVRLPRHVPHGR